MRPSAAARGGHRGPGGGAPGRAVPPTPSEAGQACPPPRAPEIPHALHPPTTSSRRLWCRRSRPGPVMTKLVVEVCAAWMRTPPHRGAHWGWCAPRGVCVCGRGLQRCPEDGGGHEGCSQELSCTGGGGGNRSWRDSPPDGRSCVPERSRLSPVVSSPLSRSLDPGITGRGCRPFLSLPFYWSLSSVLSP